MTHAAEHDPDHAPRLHPWQPRDFLAAACLFAATAAVLLWQNAHLVVLWDLSYVLDSATRIAEGQIPYRDFPFVHAPLTFLLQAAIIRISGRVYFHHVLYCAFVGGLGTVLTWRILLRSLDGRLRAAWLVALGLSAPLTVLGIYCILPLPSYDCDCAFSILAAIWLLRRLDGTEGSIRPWFGAFSAGAASVLPVFFKQNIGLVFLAGVVGAILLLLAAHWVRRDEASPRGPTLLAVLAGVAAALLTALLVLHCTAGLANYLHWTIAFAAQRRLPGLQLMLGVYREPMLLWMLPAIGAGVLLLRSRHAQALWARLLALALLAAPFLWPVLALFVYDDADERGDALLTLWPLVLLLSAALVLFRLWRRPAWRTLVPVPLLLAINGAFLSQQLWGSTYAIWPLFLLLLADLLASLPMGANPRQAHPALVLSGVIASALFLCGGFYTASEERLSYVQFPDGPVEHATVPQLAGMATPGPYLPEFEEMLRFAAARIPASDGILFVPGEDPFYFATGRVPQFPVLLFDPATDPYTPAQTAAQARVHHLLWLIVKKDLQIKADPTPDRDAVLDELLKDFKLDTRLRGYDVYRRPGSQP